VGTEKRERQKANRALRQQELAAADKRRRAVRIGIIVVGAIAAVFLLVWVVSLFSDDEGDSSTAELEPFSTEETADDESTADTAVTADSAATEGSAVADDSAAATGTTECPPEDGSAEQQQTFDGAPPMCIDETATYEAAFTTNMGEFTMTLDPSIAPETVNNFVVLARYHYFDDTVCHRIIPGFVVQCGDPTASGSGGPGYSFPDELPAEGEYQIGSVAMANSGPDTNGSQFFIITGENGAALPPDYSLFGEVTAGFDETVVAMEAAGSETGAPTEEVRITSVEITEV
jgi:cyclophilin family peptidyl-prolyl cis-trans isomerase